MTDEAIKALMIFAMYGILELVLYFSATARPARQAGRSAPGRSMNDSTRAGAED